MRCEFAHDDGAYVLGALSPRERQAFEAHLAHCAECAGAVRALAGLPGLLARVDARAALEPVTAAPLPATLLPALVRRVRRTRRRRTYAVLGGLAAAAVTIAALTVAAVTEGTNPPTAAPTASAGTGDQHTMNPVAGGLLRARVGFVNAAWGTQLDLTCSYAGGRYGEEPSSPSRYALVVRTRDGHEQQLATWLGSPGKTVNLIATTASRREDIASVEVRTAAGKTVLRSAA